MFAYKYFDVILVFEGSFGCVEVNVNMKGNEWNSVCLQPCLFDLRKRMKTKSPIIWDFKKTGEEAVEGGNT